VAAQATDNRRDCRLVTLAGILPDVDGLGLVMDLANRALGRPDASLYLEYHHFVLHGLLGGLLLAAVTGLLARRRWRVALLSLAVFHLHLLCDLAGSRGPSLADYWPIHYLAPFTRHPMWVWQGQWALDAWPNRIISVALLAYAFWLAVRRGESFVGLVSPKADAVFVGVLRKWQTALSRR
jgi:inner membrane protein